MGLTSALSIEKECEFHINRLQTKKDAYDAFR